MPRHHSCSKSSCSPCFLGHRVSLHAMLNPILPYCICCGPNYLYQDRTCDTFAFSPGKWLALLLCIIRTCVKWEIEFYSWKNQNTSLLTEKSEVFHLEMLLQCYRKALVTYISPYFPGKPQSFWITFQKAQHILPFRRHKDRDGLEGPAHRAAQEAQARCKPRAQC